MGIIQKFCLTHLTAPATQRPSKSNLLSSYPTTMALGYEGRPGALADATALPLPDSSVDTVLLLDVLANLDDPEKAIYEAARILRGGGTCLLQVPFLYALHDEPLDYQGWTIHGLKKLFLRHGFQPEVSSTSNVPCTTAAALLSMATAKGRRGCLMLSRKRVCWCL